MQYFLKSTKSFDKFLFIPLFLYSCLFLPFVGTIPYLDGNIDFVKSYDFYIGGFKELFTNWRSIHPPLKEFINYIFFKTLGLTAFAYTFVGYLVGILGITSFYKLSRKLFTKEVGIYAALFLSTSPLFVSVGIFSLTDFLLTTLIILALYFYVLKNYSFYLIFASLGVLTKETGLIFIGSVILIEILSSILAKKNPLKTTKKNFYY